MPSTQKVLDYTNADFSKLRDLMSIDWNLELSSKNTQDSWLLFKEKLSKSIEECIPLKNRRTNNKPLWMNSNIMHHQKEETTLEPL